MEGFRVALVVALGSRMWVAALNVLMLPLYARWIGHEGFGLVGVYTMFQLIVTFMDFGLGTVFIREAAKLNGDANRAKLLRDYAWTCESIYLTVALFIGLLLSGASYFLAHFWLRPETMSTAQLTIALVIASWTIALQWPNGIYGFFLTGLNRQVAFGGVNIFTATLKVALGSAALAWISPTIEMFFCAMLVGSAAQTVITRIVAYRAFPKIESGARGQFRLRFLRRIGSFAGVMSAVGVTSVLLMQIDKLVLSNTLPLSDFGIYSLVSALAAGVYVVAIPLFNVIYPRASALALSEDPVEIRNFYHLSSQIFAVALIPAVTTASFFSSEVLQIWTHNAGVVAAAKLGLVYLLIGNCLYGIMNTSFAYQLAFGKPSLQLIANFIGVLLATPLTYWLGSRYGIDGGAGASLIVALCILTVGQYLTYSRIKVGSVWRWLINDIGIAVLISLAVVGLSSLLIPVYESRLAGLLKLGLIWVTALLTCAMCLSAIRPRVMHNLKRALLVAARLTKGSM